MTKTKTRQPIPTPPSTPIEDVVKALGLSLDLPSAVRVAADLLAILDRGELTVDEDTERFVRESIT